MTAKLTRGTVVMAAERCKGCEICVAACPPGVLEMSDQVNSLGYLLPVLLPGCTACSACARVCPDFVFEVYKFDHPVLLDDDGVVHETETEIETENEEETP
jgi:2-oxoglutarate ferredoxin oxidoreductase subunit delta